MVAAELAGDIEFRHQLAKLRNVVVAFDHGRYGAEVPDRRAIQVPHRFDDGMVVGVDEMTAEIAVAGQVKLPHSGFRDGMQVGQGVEAVIHAADVDVVDVEQDGAIRSLRDFAQKLPLAHLGGLIGQVAGDVFQQNLPSQGLLHLTDPRHHRG